RNSIIWGNRGTSFVNPGFVIESSLVKGVNDADYDNPDLNSIFVDSVTNPLLARDFRLKAGSAAINAGDDQYFASESTPDLSHIMTDLDGNPRITGAVDLGAYESPYIFVDDDAIAGANHGGSWQDAFTSLHD